MRDPHVQFLRYRLVQGETWKYVNAPRLEGERNDFRYELDDGILTLHMKTHYASVEDAKASATEFLFVWELDAGPRQGLGAVSFVYLDSELIDRIPPPPGTVEIHAPAASVRIIGGTGTVTIVSESYPAPPTDMRFTPDLETLWMRYEGYRANREPLAGMAYFCLTVLEMRARGRVNAEKQYEIDYDVLDKIGELTAERGDTATARKMNVKITPYTPLEIRWIEEAIKLMIRRVAEIGVGATTPKISMKDLPAL